MAKTGISGLLIASAIDPEVYRSLVESPEKTFDAFDVAEDDRELLRHPDHRLLRVIGAALAEENATASAAAVEMLATPPAMAEVPLAETPPGISTANLPLPDMSLVLTLVPCAIYDREELCNFKYVAWVSPLPEGADPETLSPPPGTVLPGMSLPPLHAVLRVSATQMQDAAGNPLVGLSASLLKGTNMSAPIVPETAGNPEAISSRLANVEVQSAIAAVRCASTGTRYAKLIELLRILHPDGT